MTTQTIRDRILLLIKLLADDTKRRLAEMLEVSPSNIDAWINRDYAPQKEHLLKFHNKLNINLNWLLAGEGEMFVKKDQPLMVSEALAEYGYDKEEREYIQKLIQIFRDKKGDTVHLIKNSIDAFLQMPDKDKTLVKKSKAG